MSKVENHVLIRPNNSNRGSVPVSSSIPAMTMALIAAVAFSVVQTIHFFAARKAAKIFRKKK